MSSARHADSDSCVLNTTGTDTQKLGQSSSAVLYDFNSLNTQQKSHLQTCFQQMPFDQFPTELKFRELLHLEELLT